MRPEIVKPPKLQKGDTIGIIAPAGPVAPWELEPGIELLQGYGYRVLLSPHLYERNDYTAGDDTSRFEDFHEMWMNPGVKALLCARGGYGTIRILDRIDFQLIQRHPKIIVGYSDITTLLLTIYRHTALITFHGPVVREFPKNQCRNLECLIDAVSTDRPWTWELEGGKVLQPGQGEGILLGGNLSLLCSLIGMSHIPSLDGALLFIEERGEPLYRVDRMLTQLRLSGLLGGIRGLMAGDFIDCGDLSSIDTLLSEAVSDLDIPVITRLPFGHGQQNITLPMGLPAVMDADRFVISSEAPCVSALP